MSTTTNKKITKEKDDTTLKQRKVKEGDKTTSTTTTTTTPEVSKASKPGTDKIKLNYPVFCCATSSDAKNPYIVTGGGGGNSKTGVPNAITLLKWCTDITTAATTGNSSEFTLIDQMDTPDCIPFITFNESKNQLSYAVGSICYIVEFKNNKLEVVSKFDSNNGIPSNALQSALTANSNTNSPTASPTSLTSANTSTSSATDGEIRLIRFNKKGDRLILVDSNNMIKIWSLPSFEFVKLISTGHTGDITDIDIHPASTHLITSSRDCTAKIINILNGKTEFTLLYKQKPKLAFRGCKFTLDGLYCYTAQSQPRSKNSIGCTVLTKWNFINGKEELSKEVDTCHNTTFSLSPDNKVIAISTADGKITAFNSENFKQLDKWEPHDFVITGASFSPDSSSVFSSSADYNCRSHRIGFNQNNNSKFFKMLFVFAILILIVSVIFGQLLKL